MKNSTVNSSEPKRNIYKVIFIIYVLVALYFLLFAESFGRTSYSEYRYNLEFFKEIKRYLDWSEYSIYGYKMMLINIFGNILCFMPLGYLIPSVKRFKTSFIIVILITLFASFVIESIQLVFKIGSFDVDDILLNSLGGILGYLVYKLKNLIIKQKVK